MKISVVTTLYNSSSYIEEFYRRIISCLEKICISYEIIFVDDGSTDNSLDCVLPISKANNNVKVIELSRNFGHHKAMMTGLSYTDGDFVLMIDSDLEESPELLLSYWEKIKSEPNSDVIYGTLPKRKGSRWERFSGKIFYRLLNLLSGEKMPIDIAFSRLMNRNYVKNLLLFKEREMYIGGLWHINGFQQTPIIVQKSSKGISTYSLKKKVDMMLNAITSFSSMPLQMIFYFGFFTTLSSLLLVLYYIFIRLFFHPLLSGWTSLILVVLVMSGVIIMSLGIIAIYLSKIFIEVKQRPYTIVRNIY
ncbi:MAG: glycosyltransferase family 2 protein [Chlorobium sp.]